MFSYTMNCHITPYIFSLDIGHKKINILSRNIINLLASIHIVKLAKTRDKSSEQSGKYSLMLVRTFVYALLEAGDISLSSWLAPTFL